MSDSRVDLTRLVHLNGKEADELRIFHTSLSWEVISAGSTPYPRAQGPLQAPASPPSEREPTKS